MAENVRELLDQSKPAVDEKLRLRLVKERQNEERQRKLEEIKAQALAAQRFKEQKEQERRKRLEELRIKDEAKRQQVEERKRAINDAEKSRLEFILKRNQEREQRLEAKKRNERSNPVFAFGSSTPRMLEPTDLTVSFWGHRKATSIQNISSSSLTSSSLTRRQSERDLDLGNKKRATSATGLERSAENITPSIPAGCASGYVGRRKTDLVPTIPSKDSSFTSSRKSLNHSPASSRPSSSLSQQSTNSVASTMSVRHRASATPRKPRPVSIAVTGITHDVKLEKNEMKPPIPKTRKVINRDAVTKTKLASNLDNKNEIFKSLTNVEEVQSVPKATDETQKKPPDANSNAQENVDNEIPIDKKESDVENVPEVKSNNADLVSKTVKAEASQEVPPKETKPDESVEVKKEPIEIKQEQCKKNGDSVQTKNVAKVNTDNNSENKENNLSNEMTASMIKRINTEEEAKAAIAEKRRLIREEAERQAELERLRLEAEAKAEFERQQKEEEQVRQLIEMQRQAEQERLREAIREAQKKEEEERLKKEEEQKLKQLKEEAERKAREDAERQKAELQERLKNEEKEREARRKRVEAIMLRTRGKNNANLSSQNTDEKNENKDDENKDDHENKVNGTKILDQCENGTTKNGKEPEIVDNIIQSEIVKNANTIEAISSSDTLNSNNSWREQQQFGNFIVNNNN